VGVPESKLVLGKHSGRHALKKRAEDLGFDLTGRTGRVRPLHGLADNKKGLMDEEIARD
jgi:2-isopropylmalate synthase